MTQDEIIRMAQQVQDEGFAPVGIWPEVRRMCELAYSAGAAHEREACAKVCEEMIASVITKPMPLRDIVTAIRARGEK